MDPSYGLLMWSRLAGLLLEDIAGTKTSVFATAPYTDFERLTTIDTNVPKNLALGTAISLLANRVSWFFDLKGQSMTIDSACSSSLVALHLACQSIKNKDSSMVSAAAFRDLCASNNVFSVS